MNRDSYESPTRAIEQSDSHLAISKESYTITYGPDHKTAKARLIYARRDYELRFAGSLSIRVPDVPKHELFRIISSCHSWVGLR